MLRILCGLLLFISSQNLWAQIEPTGTNSLKNTYDLKNPAYQKSEIAPYFETLNTRTRVTDTNLDSVELSRPKAGLRYLYGITKDTAAGVDLSWSNSKYGNIKSQGLHDIELVLMREQAVKEGRKLLIGATGTFSISDGEISDKSANNQSGSRSLSPYIGVREEVETGFVTVTAGARLVTQRNTSVKFEQENFDQSITGGNEVYLNAGYQKEMGRRQALGVDAGILFVEPATVKVENFSGRIGDQRFGKVGVWANIPLDKDNLVRPNLQFVRAISPDAGEVSAVGTVAKIILSRSF